MAQRDTSTPGEQKQVALKFFEQLRAKRKTPGGDLKPEWWCMLCGETKELQDGSTEKVTTIQANAERLPGHLTHRSKLIKHCPQSDRVPQADMRVLKGERVSSQELTQSAIATASMTASSHGVDDRMREKGAGDAAQHRAQLQRQASMLDYEGPHDPTDTSIVRFFVMNGIPFRNLDSPEFYEMVSKIRKAPANWRPPKRTKAREKLVPKEYQRLQRKLESSVKEDFESGATLMSDGAQDIKKRQLVNYLLSTGSGTFFLNFEHFRNKSKTGLALGESMKSMIEQSPSFPPEFIQQVICDNAAAEQAALRHVQEDYGWIERASCAAHGLDLALKDIGKESNVNYIVTLVGRLSRWILKHHQFLSLLEDQGAECKPIRPVPTRFASQLAMLRRFVRLHGPLGRLLNSDELMDAAAHKGQAQLRIATLLRNKIFPRGARERHFLEHVKAVVRIMWPVHTLLRDVDSGQKMTHCIYHRMGDMIEQVRKIDCTGVPSHSSGPLSTRAAAVLEGRWNATIHADIHAAGYALNIIYIDHELEDGGEVREGVERVLRRFFFKEPGNLQQAINEFDLFRKKRAERLRNPLSLAELQKRFPAEAWRPLAQVFPQLLRVAKRVLSQPVAASQCEHIWAETDLVQTPRRNRLDVDTIDSLVFLRHNYNTTPIGRSKDGLVMQEWDEDDRQAPRECDPIPLSASNADVQEGEDDEELDLLDDNIDEDDECAIDEDEETL